MYKELVALSLKQIQEMAALKTSYDAYVRSILSNRSEGAYGDKEVVFAFGPDSVEIAAASTRATQPQSIPASFSSPSVSIRLEALLEERAFRIKNGTWSIWTIRGHDKVVGYKVVDLVLDEVKPPEQNGPSEQDVVQKVVLRGRPWIDSYGRSLTSLTVWLGKEVRWLGSYGNAQSVVGMGQCCVDEYSPEVEGEGKAQDR